MANLKKDLGALAGKLAGAVGDRLSGLLGALTPEPSRVPIPIRDTPRRRP